VGLRAAAGDHLDNGSATPQTRRSPVPRRETMVTKITTSPVTHDGHVIHEEGVTKLPESEARSYLHARYAWAVARISLGWVFLWAFLDKTFALGFATGRAEDGTIDFFGDAAWINGASPTEGFLSFGTKGPFAEFFQSFAGAAWADWTFMIALLGIGVALTLGIGMRIAAISGAVLMGLMYLAALWPENNPFMDDHIIYGIVLIGLMVASAGDTFGFGKAWKSTKLVQRYPFLA
jgi:thiosulfate dehydrogenase (quinone) large subunit